PAEGAHVQTALVVLISYLLGSIPTSNIAARLRGVDLRRVGSGNPGFTNVLRTMGARVAAPVLIVDIAKGVAAVLFVAGTLGDGSSLRQTGIGLAAGLAAVAGHIWPVFARFRGGKGVATACGVFAAMAPLATLAAVVLWLAIVIPTRYVSLGSIAAALFLPWAIWIEGGILETGRPTALMLTAGLVAVAVVLRHLGNIKRLLNGTENRFGRTPKQEGER
ncbi:MAG: glycerol-3-phosphate 1-O-acyltransferase PlsY, partial [Candidatus Eisenbacteria bacterium]|nr:glycerol-3-phosphate 1-O-acyltransferase PlsY [Candidatus Eisenbacteria bacterium]